MRNWINWPAIFATFLVIGVSITGCVNETPVNQTPPVPTQGLATPTSTDAPTRTNQETGITSTYGEAKTVVEANNHFAFDLYANLRRDPQLGKSNIFFSPFSMSSALAITFEGARGKTADEIGSVLYFPKDSSVRRQLFHDLNAGINQNDPNYSLRTANALWAEKTYTFLPDYLNTVRNFYSADATNLDFINAPEDSRGTINMWVESKTDGKITNLLPSGSIDATTRLVITNAVYFNGSWKYPFLPNSTRDAKFTISPSETVDVKMMAQTSESLKFNYTETDQLQMVEMPYNHGTGLELSMLVILPKGDNLSAVEHSLDTTFISGLRNGLQPQLVYIYLPKYRIETQYRMDPVLRDMGMPTAFSSQSDFSGMDGSRNLSISTVVHKAYIEVDEKGTKAAAATGVVMVLGQAYHEPENPILFRADHPFLFIIQDRESGNVLFMGRIMNPNA